MPRRANRFQFQPYATFDDLIDYNLALFVWCEVKELVALVALYPQLF
jgi:hypothetical protein